MSAPLFLRASLVAEKASRQEWGGVDCGRAAEHVVRATRQFRDQPWTVVRLSRQTQADQIWRVKAARVWLHGEGGWSAGAYWLIWASNAPSPASSMRSTTIWYFDRPG